MMNAPSCRVNLLWTGMSKLALACLIAGLLTFLCLPEAQAQSKERPSKYALSAANMEELHRLIRPQKGEFKWDEIPWYASIWHARKAAAAQDKPIFVFGTGGAGFNDPLGNC